MKTGSPDFYCDWPGNERVQIGTMCVHRIVLFLLVLQNEHMDQQRSEDRGFQG